MKPINFKEANLILNKPEGWTDEQCQPLPVLAMESKEGPFMISCWQPTEEDIKLIVAGNPVYLQLYGNQHPPVMLYTVREDGIPVL